jgi:exonuclease V gamma subunit
LEKKRSPQEALLKTQNTWQGSEYSRGEGEDAYYQLCFRNTNPMDSDFQKISKKILSPLLMHQSEIGK